MFCCHGRVNTRFLPLPLKGIPHLSDGNGIKRQMWYDCCMSKECVIIKVEGRNWELKRIRLGAGRHKYHLHFLKVSRKYVGGLSCLHHAYIMSNVTGRNFQIWWVVLLNLNDYVPCSCTHNHSFFGRATCVWEGVNGLWCESLLGS